MALPSQFELCNLFYACKVANPTFTPAQCLDDVKLRWQQSASKLRAIVDEREFEMTQAEIDQAIIDAAADGVTSLQELKPIWEAELVAEINGFNRPEVIAELEANIASVPA